MARKKILVVDDDDIVRKTIINILELEGKYDIEEAQDGLIAEKKIEEFIPDLIILDIKMPNKDGYEVFWDLKKKPDKGHIKVIAVSGFSGQIGGAIMDALGADSFFEKPLDIKKFRERVNALLKEE
ncbi:MAG: response regulator [Candidatus Omnitrophica bacterium]|nr:response regulator [Candidatus Omnitrophota bacterium]